MKIGIETAGGIHVRGKLGELLERPARSGKAEGRIVG